MKDTTLLLTVAAVGAGALLLARKSGASMARPSGIRRWPVSTYRGTISSFGASRTRPGGVKAYHAAADVGAFPGDRVVAIDDGVVLHAVSGFSLGAGLQAVAIRHPDADYIYAELAVSVAPGATVSRGGVVGTVAQNGDGNSMLHLEAWETGKAPPGFVSWDADKTRPVGLLDVSAILSSGVWDKSSL